jgi:hypothetical protein
VIVVVLGNQWWTAEASSYARYVYKPLEASATVADGRLTLGLRDPGWISTRRLDDVVLDHGHPMHLFVVSPALDRLWHLHPADSGAGQFTQALPAMPAGEYELFADIVHKSGISETVTGRLAIAGAIVNAPLTGDDSAWMAGRDLSDGYRMTWVRDDHALEAGRLTMFTFRVEDAMGQPASDLELYMGMPGHAIFVARDRQVFAHVHPSGSVPMAALEIGERSLASAGRPDPGHQGHLTGVPAVVTFPFGLPRAGEYRIFVQVKRAGRIETAAFDATVE